MFFLLCRPTSRFMKKQQKDKKELIISSALRVMSKKGYYGSTMDDIVADSKMSKGAIYHYYKSKKEVYLGVIESLENEYTELFAKINSEPTTAKTLKKLFSFLIGIFITWRSVLRPVVSKPSTGLTTLHLLL